ncbi:MAG TPA: acyltransferase family protein [Ilumatobacter sp.]|nr:acyltransferase family protein [Ilumatobacter sp.]
MRPTIAYQPALDGVRALAVLAVLLFHGGVWGFSGGYLGVSVFFTLSGYLITSLLVHEHDATGRIDLGTFYARRLRRLLPASALCLAAIVVAARVTDWFDRVEALRSHVLGSVLQVANWVFLAGDGSYQNLLAQEAGAASPLEHFWSLAIEEQFYWVWPPFITLLFARVAARRRRLAVVASVTAVALLSAPLIAAVWGPDAAYWSTPARIGEILVGAWLAVALRYRRSERGLDQRWAYAAPAALVLLGVGVATFPAAGGPAYHGALPLVALVSGALLVGLQVDGPVQRALGWRPLVGLGKISYGVYLFHWPLYVVLDEGRTGLDGVALLAVRLGATLALSVVSYRLFEAPIRHASVPRIATFGAAVAATAAVSVAAWALVPLGLGEYWNVDAGTAEAAAINPDDDTPLTPITPAPTTTTSAVPTSTPNTAGTTEPAGPAPTVPPGTTEPPATTVPPLPALARPLRVLVVGDSTARALGTGVVTWAAAHPELAQAEVVAAPGCGFVESGERRIGDSIEPPVGCQGWVAAQVLPEVAALKPDVVVAMVSSWDIVDRRWEGEAMLTPADPEFAAHVRADYTRFVDEVLAAGAGGLAFVRHPVPNVWWLDDFTGQSDPARHELIYDLYAELSAERPQVRVVDLAGWMAAGRLDVDEAVRPDGIHLTPEAAERVTADVLGDELVRVALGLAGTWTDAP